MLVVNVKKEKLKNRGIQDFEEWSSNPNNIYIGRNMSFYVPGTFKSKWANPYTVKKYGLEECLCLYEEMVRNGPLLNDLKELEGKELGCWCIDNESSNEICCLYS